MRWYHRSIITPAAAAEIAADVRYRAFSESLFAGIVRQVLENAPMIALDAPSYIRVEERPSGCPWHNDTGTGSGHMGWCRYSAGVLLTDPAGFSGGGFHYSDDGPIFHYCDLAMWDDAPENRHYVASSGGGRKALLMFFAAA